ncbi:MAG: hypothetical protein MHM6MM_003321 [Cercozoa sp. M6MM]
MRGVLWKSSSSLLIRSRWHARLFELLGTKLCYYQCDCKCASSATWKLLRNEAHVSDVQPLSEFTCGADCDMLRGFRDLPGPFPQQCDRGAKPVKSIDLRAMIEPPTVRKAKFELTLKISLDFGKNPSNSFDGARTKTVCLRAATRFDFVAWRRAIFHIASALFPESQESSHEQRDRSICALHSIPCPPHLVLPTEALCDALSEMSGAHAVRLQPRDLTNSLEDDHETNLLSRILVRDAMMVRDPSGLAESIAVGEWLQVRKEALKVPQTVRKFFKTTTESLDRDGTFSELHFMLRSMCQLLRLMPESVLTASLSGHFLNLPAVGNVEAYAENVRIDVIADSRKDELNPSFDDLRQFRALLSRVPPANRRLVVRAAILLRVQPALSQNSLGLTVVHALAVGAGNAQVYHEMLVEASKISEDAPPPMRWSEPTENMLKALLSQLCAYAALLGVPQSREPTDAIQSILRLEDDSDRARNALLIASDQAYAGVVNRISMNQDSWRQSIHSLHRFSVTRSMTLPHKRRPGSQFEDTLHDLVHSPTFMLTDRSHTEETVPVSLTSSVEDTSHASLDRPCLDESLEERETVSVALHPLDDIPTIATDNVFQTDVAPAQANTTQTVDSKSLQWVRNFESGSASKRSHRSVRSSVKSSVTEPIPETSESPSRRSSQDLNEEPDKDFHMRVVAETLPIEDVPKVEQAHELLDARPLQAEAETETDQMDAMMQLQKTVPLPAVELESKDEHIDRDIVPRLDLSRVRQEIRDKFDEELQSLGEILHGEIARSKAELLLQIEVLRARLGECEANTLAATKAIAAVKTARAPTHTQASVESDLTESTVDTSSSSTSSSSMTHSANQRRKNQSPKRGETTAPHWQRPRLRIFTAPTSEAERSSKLMNTTLVQRDRRRQLSPSARLGKQLYKGHMAYSTRRSR